MPKWRDRECKRCHETSWTASKADFCQLCQMANKRDEIIKRESKDLEEWGYSTLDGPYVDKFNHRVYRVLTICGHEWEAPYNNIRKQALNSEQKKLPQPCPVCGPKRRMKVALSGFMEKYARDYDLNEYEDYMKKVRGLSDKTYTKFKKFLNPHNLDRGMKTYHLDHKIPIIECFKQGWTPEEAASLDNLQLLPYQENLSKGASTGYISLEILL